MRTLTLNALCAVALALPASAQILYVDAAMPAGGDGSSWAKAYSDLGNALAAATPGTTLWVAIGGYTGNFSIPAGVTVLGGFLGDARSVSGAGDVSLLQRTFQNRTNIVASGGRGVTLGQGAVLDNFWILFGAGGAPGGGGALIDGVDAKIRNCFFRTNNDTVGAGAALMVRNSQNSRIENSVFAFNGDPASGAAVEFSGSGGWFLNNTVDLNEHSGLKLTNGANPVVRNNIFTNNGATSGATAYGVEQVGTGSNPTVEHNLFFGNNSGLYLHGATVHASGASLNGAAFASNNLDVDPLYNGINDWRLQVSSPCIDAGHPSSFPQRTQGLYDQSRRLDGNLDGVVGIDIGAAEFSHVQMQLPVDTHRHIHLGLTGTAGLPGWVWVSAGEFPNGLPAMPAGYFFLSPVGAFLVPYFTIPTPGGNAINYPNGFPAGVKTYWQAMTFQGAGVNLSNPGVHVTNP